MHAKERLEVLDAENIDVAILYTTVGLLCSVEPRPGSGRYMGRIRDVQRRACGETT